jgi:ribokinase
MNTTNPRITVVGSFAVGLTMRAPRFPVKGETLLGRDFDMGPGGKGSNQAVGAARLGAKSHFVGLIGEDLFGEMAIQLYAAEGVHTEYLRRTSARNTGVGFITLNDAGDNHIVLDMGANELLMPADVDHAEPVIAQSDAVLAVLEIPPAAAARAMELARRHHVTAILNPAPATALVPALLANVDVLTPNESELRILLGLAPDDPTDTLELAGRLRQMGVRNIVVTRGAQGALVIYADGATEQIPGIPVNVVDTTGAGDAFTCALGVGLAKGETLSDAVRYATYAGALACTKLGVIPALATGEEIAALMANA